MKWQALMGANTLNGHGGRVGSYGVPGVKPRITGSSSATIATHENATGRVKQILATPHGEGPNEGWSGHEDGKLLTKQEIVAALGIGDDSALMKRFNDCWSNLETAYNKRGSMHLDGMTMPLVCHGKRFIATWDTVADHLLISRRNGTLDRFRCLIGMEVGSAPGKQQSPVPEGYKTLSEVCAMLNVNDAALLQQYWPTFSARTAMHITQEQRKAGAVVTVVTEGNEGAELTLQYQRVRSANSRPLMLLNVGVNNERLADWASAARLNDERGVFRNDYYSVSITPISETEHALGR